MPGIHSDFPIGSIITFGLGGTACRNLIISNKFQLGGKIIEVEVSQSQGGSGGSAPVNSPINNIPISNNSQIQGHYGPAFTVNDVLTNVQNSSARSFKDVKDVQKITEPKDVYHVRIRLGDKEIEKTFEVVKNRKLVAKSITIYQKSSTAVKKIYKNIKVLHDSNLKIVKYFKIKK